MASGFLWIFGRGAGPAGGAGTGLLGARKWACRGRSGGPAGDAVVDLPGVQ